MFAANIVNYVVQYESLRTDNGKEFLKEEVDAARIRPYPPRVVVSRYKMFEPVDVLHNFGWHTYESTLVVSRIEIQHWLFQHWLIQRIESEKYRAYSITREI